MQETQSENSRVPKVISVVNQKGGCGKTTLSFNIIKNLQRNNRKYEVVAVDLDQQKNLKSMLPEICLTDVAAKELKEIESDFVVVDNPPLFSNETIHQLMHVDVVVVPLLMERLDLENTQSFLETAKAVGAENKIKIVLLHNGSNTLIYKSLRPYIDELVKEYGCEILCEMRKSQTISKANLQGKTPFEITSPKNVRDEFKTLFKELNRCLH